MNSQINAEISEHQKLTILAKAKSQNQAAIRERRVEAVIVEGAMVAGKGTFLSGWKSGMSGHWGVVVDG